jgi:type III pantothenate kinase
MLLTIDIGNSTTKFGPFDHGEFLTRFTIPTDRSQTHDKINASIIKNLPPEIHAVIVSSVVPELNDPYAKFFKKHFDLEPLFVDHTWKFDMKIRYEPKQSLGIDRAIAAWYAMYVYGAPVIVCDFGTATTIDVVDTNGDFIGGIIAPGISTLADSLFEKTAKLPKVDIKKPAKVIGNSTVSGIQSGIYFGYAGLVEKILEKMIEELGEVPTIIATGGFAGLIAEGVEMIEIVDENLVLEGLNLIHENAEAARSKGRKK